MLRFEISVLGIRAVGLSALGISVLSTPGNGASASASPSVSRTLPPRFVPLSRGIGSVVVHPFASRKAFIACTATHLGDGFVLTAGHCLLGAPRCNGAVVRFPKEFAPDGAVKEFQESPCESVLSISADDARYRGPHEDYALMRVKNPPREFVELESRGQVGS